MALSAAGIVDRRDGDPPQGIERWAKIEVARADPAAAAAAGRLTADSKFFRSLVFVALVLPFFEFSCVVALASPAVAFASFYAFCRFRWEATTTVFQSYVQLRLADAATAAGGGPGGLTTKEASMSLWEDHGMAERVRAVLTNVHVNNPGGHHFGRPYLSSYQIALALVEADADLPAALGKEIGGVGTGAHHSLAQYIGQRLSAQISTDLNHFAEGAFMSNERVVSLVYRGPGDRDVASSLAGTDFDMALFRLRA